MILRELVLHNFGVFRGRQVVDLAPRSAKRPVILFGGLNGGGKTTLLDALQLVLYGRLGKCSNRGDTAYEEFLRRSIHHAEDPHQGAAIELEFTHTTDGKPEVFRVRRSWSLREKHIGERVEVLRDGALDQLLTEAWAEHIEDLIPVRLSNFFFFDGEKIEALADLERSNDALSVAVHSLLGLDLVDQLATDLVSLERRKRTEQKSAPKREAIAAAKQEVDRLATRRDDLVLECGIATNAVERAEKALREAAQRYALGGGDAFELTKAVEIERASKAQELERVDDELRAEAELGAPLLLVTDLLDAVASDDEAEQVARAARDLGELLATRDARAMSTATAAQASKQVIAALAEFLAADREHYERAANTESYLNLSTEAQTMLRGVRASLGAEVPARIARLLAEAGCLIGAVDALDNKLASAPAEDLIAGLAAERRQAQDSRAQAAHALRVAEAEAERIVREHEQKWDVYARLLGESIDEQHEHQAVQRILTYSERTRETLKQFRGAVVERRVQRIEQLVLEGFQHLLRKKSLVTALHIDPKTFSMTLLGANGSELLPERLSAGERQILAICTIWGLARASARPLPVVIDTPLGRLDSVHRRHLVERYFTHASHQVLLLSTDKEIDAELYAELKPSVSHAYTLRFDDKSASTTIERGYFW